tara:strand:- start:265 stop:747 length:483 start_codon:yes stop_codon:yes gene_type:complete
MTKHWFEQFGKRKTCSLCGVVKELNERYNSWDYDKLSIPKVLHNRKRIMCDQVWKLRSHPFHATDNKGRVTSRYEAPNLGRYTNKKDVLRHIKFCGYRVRCKNCGHRKKDHVLYDRYYDTFEHPEKVRRELRNKGYNCGVTQICNKDQHDLNCYCEGFKK